MGRRSEPPVPQPNPVPANDPIPVYFAKHSQSWEDRYTAEDFDSHHYRMRANIALRWLAALPIPPASWLLEVGCGAGVQSEAASRLGWRVIGADLSLGMVRQAAGSRTGPRWMCAAAAALPFRPRQFNVIMMLGVIGYTRDPAGVLALLRESLRPGGTLIISWASSYLHHTILLRRISEFISAIPNAIYLRAKAAVTRRPTPPHAVDGGFYNEHNKYWDERQFCALLEEAGFRVTRRDAVNFGVLRFMDRRLWPERVDLLVTRFVEFVSRLPLLGFLRNTARGHVVMAVAASDPPA